MTAFTAMTAVKGGQGDIKTTRGKLQESIHPFLQLGGMGHYVGRLTEYGNI